MTAPKIPRFMVRFHDKSEVDMLRFREIFDWLTAHVRGQWCSEITVVREIGTTLGARSYDCGYKIIYLNDPDVIMMFKLTFGDHILIYRDYKKFIHPLMMRVQETREILVHEGTA